MTVVRHDHEVVAGQHAVQIREQFILEPGREGRVVHQGDLEHLDEERLPHVAPLRDRGSVRPDEEARRHVGSEVSPDEPLLGILAAEGGHEIHGAAEAGDVIGTRERATGVTLLPHLPRRDDRLLGRLAERQAVAVLVDDRLADHQDAEIAQGRQAGQHVGDGVPCPEPVEKAAGVVRAGARRVRAAPGRGPHLGRGRCAVDATRDPFSRVPVTPVPRPDIVGRQEGGGREDRLVREAHLASDLVHGVDLGLEPHGRAREILELPSLDVVVGPEESYRFDGRRRAVDGHEVDAVQRGQSLGPETRGEDGSPWSLVHVPVRGHRHDQEVAHPAGRLEVLDVADVQEVETSVAVDHRLAAAPHGVELRRDGLQRLDLPLRHLRLLGLPILPSPASSPNQRTPRAPIMPPGRSGTRDEKQPGQTKDGGPARQAVHGSAARPRSTRTTRGPPVEAPEGVPSAAQAAVTR